MITIDAGYLMDRLDWIGVKEIGVTMEAAGSYQVRLKYESGRVSRHRVGPWSQRYEMDRELKQVLSREMFGPFGRVAEAWRVQGLGIQEAQVEDPERPKLLAVAQALRRRERRVVVAIVVAYVVGMVTGWCLRVGAG